MNKYPTFIASGRIETCIVLICEALDVAIKSLTHLVMFPDLFVHSYFQTRLTALRASSHLISQFSFSLPATEIQVSHKIYLTYVSFFGPLFDQS